MITSTPQVQDVQDVKMSVITLLHCNYRLHCNSAQEAQHKTRRVLHVICSPLYGSEWHRSVCSGGSWPWPPLFYPQEFRKPGAKGTCLMAMHCY